MEILTYEAYFKFMCISKFICFSLDLYVLAISKSQVGKF